MSARVTRTGGRPAIEGVIRGRYSLSVGRPDVPVAPGWEWAALSSLARLESGHTPSRRHPEYWDGHIPWIGIRDATANHGRTLTDTAQHTNDLGIANSSARVLPANTVCLSRTASVGYVVVMGRPMATSQDFVNWVCSEHLDHRFLKYVLLAEHDTLLSFASGTTHQTIYFPEVKAFHVCRPPVSVQQRIASVLAAIDDLIENNRRRVEVLEEMARAIYREWFVRFRYPGHEDVPLVDSPLGPIPEGWAWMPFSAVARFVNGFAFKPQHWTTIGRPIIKIKELKQGVTESTPRCDEALIDKRYWIEAGQLLFSWSADLGVYRWSGEPGLLNQHLFVVESCGGASIAYLEHSLRASMPQFWDRAQGTTMRHIKRSALTEVLTVLPPEVTITAFTEAVEPLAQAALTLQAQSATLAAARNLLLPRLVTGRIDVSHLDLEAASA